MRRTLVPLFWLCVLLIHPPAIAGPLPEKSSETLRLSLARAIELALAKNTAILEGREKIEIARAQLAQARSGYFPRVNLMAGSVVMEEAQKFAVPPGNIAFDLSTLGFPAIPGVFDPSKPISNSETLEIPITEQWINFGLLTVTQPLFTGGMIRGYNRQAKQGLSVARHGARRSRQQVIQTVVRRYNDVLITRRLFDIASSALKKLQTVLLVTKRLHEAGSQKVNRLDLLQTRIFVTSASSFIETLRQSRALALEGLKFAIGLDAKTKIEPTATTFPLAPVKRSCEDNVDEAMRQRPEVGLLSSGIRALEAGVDVAWSRYLPDLALTGGYLLDDKSIRFTDGHTFFAGLVLNFNIFEGLMTRAKVAEARARVAQLRHKERYLSQGVSLQVRKACMDIERAKRQLQLTAESLRTAEEHLSLSDNGYQADLVELEDLLKSQMMEAMMRFQHVKARYDLSNHLLELRGAIGDLSRYSQNQGGGR